MSRTTVHELRKQLRQQVKERRPQTPLPDSWSETDEMFQNVGKKGAQHLDEDDPPRRRANKQRGHGTSDNDRPPIVGSVGRISAQVRLRVVYHTDSATLNRHVHCYTLASSQLCTDEGCGYNQIER